MDRSNSITFEKLSKNLSLDIYYMDKISNIVLSDEMYKHSIDVNSWNISYVKNPSEDIQIYAVNKGCSLSHIKNPSENVKMMCVKKNINDIKYVKKPSNEIVSYFVDTVNHNNEDLIIEIFKNVKKTKANVLMFVKIYPKIVKYVKSNIKDYIKLACELNYNSLYLINDKFKKRKYVCKLACEGCGLALKHVPEELKSKKLCKLAVTQNGLALEFVPEEFKSQEMCKVAVNKDGLAIEFVPKKFQIKEVCSIAVKQNGQALEFIENPSELVQVLAVMNDPLSILHVKDTCSDMLKMIALYKDPNSLQAIDEPTEEMELVCVKGSSYGIQLVGNISTENVYLASVKRDGRTIEYVKDVNRTEDICLAACKSYGKAIEYIDEPTEEMVNIHNEQCDMYGIPHDCSDELFRSKWLIDHPGIV